MGDEGYIYSALQAKAKEVEDASAACVSLLREEYTHELWLVTRLSLQNRFDHWIKLVRPIDIEGSGAAGRVDAAVWGAAQVALGVQIEDSGDPGMLNGLLRHRVRLPLKLKWFGLRSCEDMKEIAYVGGLAAAVPFFCRTQRPGEAPTGLAVHLRGWSGALGEHGAMATAHAVRDQDRQRVLCCGG